MGFLLRGVSAAAVASYRIDAEPTRPVPSMIARHVAALKRPIAWAKETSRLQTPGDEPPGYLYEPPPRRGYGHNLSISARKPGLWSGFQSDYSPKDPIEVVPKQFTVPIGPSIGAGPWTHISRQKLFRCRINQIQIHLE